MCLYLPLRFTLCCNIPCMNLTVLSVVFESTKASEIYGGLGLNAEGLCIPMITVVGGRVRQEQPYVWMKSHPGLAIFLFMQTSINFSVVFTPVSTPAYKRFFSFRE